jgi:hydrogenase maturation protease
MEIDLPLRSLIVFNRAMKTLVIGLGNPLLKDDSVGLRVIQRLREELADGPQVELAEDYWGGLRLMERMIGYERAIVIDAISTGDPPGTIHRLSTTDIPTQRSASAHDVNLPTALELGRRAGAALPADEDITLFGIEAADVLSFDESLTPEVAAAIPEMIKIILDELKIGRGTP